MAGLEIPFITQIVIDIMAGIVLGLVWKQIERVVLLAGVGGFVLTVVFIGLGNPETFTNLSIVEANQRITFIVTSMVYFMVHLLLVEIGAIPSNLITQFVRNR